MPFDVVVDNGVIQFNLVDFRLLFPLIDSVSTSDVQVEIYWGIASSYMTATQLAIVDVDSQFLLLNQMTAHLIAYNDIVVDGATSVSDGGQGFGMAQIVVNASEDNVSASTLPPPTDDDYYAWFMSLTPYGRSFYALLSVKSQVGILIGGSASLSAINGFRSNW